MQKLLAVFLAGVFLVSLFGCLGATAQDKAGGNKIEENNVQEKTLDIEEGDLPVIEDLPEIVEDEIPGTETY